MDKEEESEHYPLKSLHDFLSELDKEWGKFRTASLIGIVTSSLLIVFLIYRFLGLLWRIRNLGLRFVEVLDEFIFLVLVAAFISYEIYLLLKQYRFFTRWERRIGLLLHLEESLIGRAEEKIGQSEERAS
jgi:hypothetical protein